MEKLDKHISILLVEDNVLNQKLIFLNLSKYGFVIDAANNGKEALDKVSSQNYDLILMDLMMPVMDGLESAKKIREKEKESGNHIPIIGLTANTFDADREKCLAHGMDEYMPKPFDINLFENILRELNIL
ncbi:response regulator [Marinilabiliaceae bacterium JC017]|nr:response regulator [Marinilabiliaceae bacterium JC017]